MKTLVRFLNKLAFVLLFLIGSFLVAVFVDYGWFEYVHRYRYTNRHALKQLTEVKFPKCKVIEKTKIRGHNPYCIRYVTKLQFEELPNDAFFDELQSHVKDTLAVNDTIVFSKPYRYFTLSNIGWRCPEFLIHGNVDLQIVRGSQAFEVSLCEWRYYHW